MSTPIEHCQQLMALLEDLDPDHYDHNVFRVHVTGRCCALGHAARAGIGGLRIGTAWSPWLVDRPHLMIDEAADIVFGTHAWDRVFNVEALNTRLGVGCSEGFTTFDWTLHGEPATEDAVYCAGRGQDALDAAKAALAAHMVLLP